MARRYSGRPAGTDTFLVSQKLYRECCQSIDVHRFDCDHGTSKRGRGPFLPLKVKP